MFGAIRDGALNSLALDTYTSMDRPHSRERRISWALNPEPFLLALQRAGVDVEAWMRELLGGGRPKLVHTVLNRHLAADDNQRAEDAQPAAVITFALFLVERQSRHDVQVDDGLDLQHECEEKAAIDPRDR